MDRRGDHSSDAAFLPASTSPGASVASSAAAGGSLSSVPFPSTSDDTDARSPLSIANPVHATEWTAPSHDGRLSVGGVSRTVSLAAPSGSAHDRTSSDARLPPRRARHVAGYYRPLRARVAAGAGRVADAFGDRSAWILQSASGVTPFALDAALMLRALEATALCAPPLSLFTLGADRSPTERIAAHYSICIGAASAARIGRDGAAVPPQWAAAMAEWQERQQRYLNDAGGNAPSKSKDGAPRRLMGAATAGGDLERSAMRTLPAPPASSRDRSFEAQKGAAKSMTASRSVRPTELGTSARAQKSTDKADGRPNSKEEEDPKATADPDIETRDDDDEDERCKEKRPFKPRGPPPPHPSGPFLAALHKELAAEELRGYDAMPTRKKKQTPLSQTNFLPIGPFAAHHLRPVPPLPVYGASVRVGLAHGGAAWVPCTIIAAVPDPDNVAPSRSADADDAAFHRRVSLSLRRGSARRPSLPRRSLGRQRSSLVVDLRRSRRSSGTASDGSSSDSDLAVPALDGRSRRLTSFDPQALVANSTPAAFRAASMGPAYFRRLHAHDARRSMEGTSTGPGAHADSDGEAATEALAFIVELTGMPDEPSGDPIGGSAVPMPELSSALAAQPFGEVGDTVAAPLTDVPDAISHRVASAVALADARSPPHSIAVSTAEDGGSKAPEMDSKSTTDAAPESGTFLTGGGFDAPLETSGRPRGVSTVSTVSGPPAGYHRRHRGTVTQRYINNATTATIARTDGERAVIVAPPAAGTRRYASRLALRVPGESATEHVAAEHQGREDAHRAERGLRTELLLKTMAQSADDPPPELMRRVLRMSTKHCGASLGPVVTVLVDEVKELYRMANARATLQYILMHPLLRRHVAPLDISVRPAPGAVDGEDLRPPSKRKPLPPEGTDAEYPFPLSFDDAAAAAATGSTFGGHLGNTAVDGDTDVKKRHVSLAQKVAAQAAAAAKKPSPARDNSAQSEAVAALALPPTHPLSVMRQESDFTAFDDLPDTHDRRPLRLFAVPNSDSRRFQFRHASDDDVRRWKAASGEDVPGIMGAQGFMALGSAIDRRALSPPRAAALSPPRDDATPKASATAVAVPPSSMPPRSSVFFAMASTAAQVETADQTRDLRQGRQQIVALARQLEASIRWAPGSSEAIGSVHLLGYYGGGRYYDVLLADVDRYTAQLPAEAPLPRALVTAVTQKATGSQSRGSRIKSKVKTIDSDGGSDGDGDRKPQVVTQRSLRKEAAGLHSVAPSANTAGVGARAGPLQAMAHFAVVTTMVDRAIQDAMSQRPSPRGSPLATPSKAGFGGTPEELPLAVQDPFAGLKPDGFYLYCGVPFADFVDANLDALLAGREHLCHQYTNDADTAITDKVAGHMPFAYLTKEAFFASDLGRVFRVVHEQMAAVVHGIVIASLERYCRFFAASLPVSPEATYDAASDRYYGIVGHRVTGQPSIRVELLLVEAEDDGAAAGPDEDVASDAEASSDEDLDRALRGSQARRSTTGSEGFSKSLGYRRPSTTDEAPFDPRLSTSAARVRRASIATRRRSEAAMSVASLGRRSTTGSHVSIMKSPVEQEPLPPSQRVVCNPTPAVAEKQLARHVDAMVETAGALPRLERVSMTALAFTEDWYVTGIPQDHPAADAARSAVVDACAVLTPLAASLCEGFQHYASPPPLPSEDVLFGNPKDTTALQMALDMTKEKLSKLPWVAPDYVHAGAFIIDCTPAKRCLEKQWHDRLEALYSVVEAKIVEVCSSANAKMKAMHARLSVRPTTAEEMQELVAFSLEALRVVTRYERRECRYVLGWIRLLEHSRRAVAPEAAQAASELLHWPASLDERFSESESSAAIEREVMMKDLEVFAAQLSERVDEAAVQVDALYAVSDVERVDATTAQAAALREDLEGIGADIAILHRRQAIFEVDELSFPRLQPAVNSFEVLEQFWTTVRDATFGLHQFKETPIAQLDVDEITDSPEEWRSLLRAATRSLRGFPETFHVGQRVEAQIARFQDVSPTIVLLRGPGMRLHHWRQLAKAMNVPPVDDMSPRNAEVTITWLMERNLLDYGESIAEITTAATLEHGMERQLEAMKAEARTLRLQFTKPAHAASDDIKALSNVAELNAVVDGFLSETVHIIGSPVKGPHHGVAEEWATLLTRLRSTVNAWASTQEFWLQLVPVLRRDGSGPGARMALQSALSAPDATRTGSPLKTAGGRKDAVSRFAAADAEMCSVIDEVERAQRHVMAVMTLETLLPRLTNIEATLRDVRRTVVGMTYAKREAFARLHFVPDEQLIGCLTSHDMDAVSAMLPALFPRLAALDATRSEILGFISRDGVKLPCPVPLPLKRTAIDVFLRIVEGGMYHALLHALGKACADKCRMPLRQWLLQGYPGQVVDLVSRAEFCQDLRDVLAHTGTKGLTAFAKKHQRVMAEMVGVLRARATLRTTDAVVITNALALEVAHRDTIQTLIACKTATVEDLEAHPMLRVVFKSGDPARAAAALTAAHGTVTSNSAPASQGTDAPGADAGRTVAGGLLNLAPNSNNLPSNVESVTVHLFHTAHRHGLEFHGNSFAPALTPELFRHQRGLLLAMSGGTSSALLGRHGAGKSETVRDVGTLLGRYVVAVQCTSALGFDAGIAPLVRAAASIGAWVVLEDVTSLSATVASRVGALTTRLAKARADSIDRHGSELQSVRLPLDDLVECRLGTQGNSAGHAALQQAQQQQRDADANLVACPAFALIGTSTVGIDAYDAALPPALASAFRPVSMDRPAFEDVARLQMLAEGFSACPGGEGAARDLAAKVALVFGDVAAVAPVPTSLSRLTAVIRAAARSTDRLVDPDLSVVDSLLTVLRPALPPDVARGVFDKVVADVFGEQGARAVAEERDAMSTLLDDGANASTTTVHADDEVARRLRQLLLHQQPVYIVGPAFSGKTSAIAKALGSERFSKAITVAPAALPASLLFGFHSSGSSIGPGGAPQDAAQGAATTAGTSAVSDDSSGAVTWQPGILDAVAQRCSAERGTRAVVFEGGLPRGAAEEIWRHIVDPTRRCVSSGGPMSVLPAHTTVLFKVSAIEHATPRLVGRCAVLALPEARDWRSVLGDELDRARILEHVSVAMMQLGECVIPILLDVLDDAAAPYYLPAPQASVFRIVAMTVAMVKDIFGERARAQALDDTTNSREEGKSKRVGDPSSYVTADTVEQSPVVSLQCFLFSVLWVLGGPVEEDLRDDFGAVLQVCATRCAAIVSTVDATNTRPVLPPAPWYEYTVTEEGWLPFVAAEDAEAAALLDTSLDASMSMSDRHAVARVVAGTERRRRSAALLSRRAVGPMREPAVVPDAGEVGGSDDGTAQPTAKSLQNDLLQEACTTAFDTALPLWRQALPCSGTVVRQRRALQRLYRLSPVLLVGPPDSGKSAHLREFAASVSEGTGDVRVDVLRHHASHGSTSAALHQAVTGVVSARGNSAAHSPPLGRTLVLVVDDANLGIYPSTYAAAALGEQVSAAATARESAGHAASRSGSAAPSPVSLGDTLRSRGLNQSDVAADAAGLLSDLAKQVTELPPKHADISPDATATPDADLGAPLTPSVLAWLAFTMHRSRLMSTSGGAVPLRNTTAVAAARDATRAAPWAADRTLVDRAFVTLRCEALTTPSLEKILNAAAAAAAPDGLADLGRHGVSLALKIHGLCRGRFDGGLATAAKVHLHGVDVLANSVEPAVVPLFNPAQQPPCPTMATAASVRTCLRAGQALIDVLGAASESVAPECVANEVWRVFAGAAVVPVDRTWITRTVDTMSLQEIPQLAEAAGALMQGHGMQSTSNYAVVFDGGTAERVPKDRLLQFVADGATEYPQRPPVYLGPTPLSVSTARLAMAEAEAAAGEATAGAAEEARAAVLRRQPSVAALHAVLKSAGGHNAEALFSSADLVVPTGHAVPGKASVPRVIVPAVGQRLLPTRALIRHAVALIGHLNDYAAHCCLVTGPLAPTTALANFTAKHRYGRHLPKDAPPSTGAPDEGRLGTARPPQLSSGPQDPTADPAKLEADAYAAAVAESVAKTAAETVATTIREPRGTPAAMLALHTLGYACVVAGGDTPSEYSYAAWVRDVRRAMRWIAGAADRRAAIVIPEAVLHSVRGPGDRSVAADVDHAACAGSLPAGLGPSEEELTGHLHTAHGDRSASVTAQPHATPSISAGVRKASGVPRRTSRAQSTALLSLATFGAPTEDPPPLLRSASDASAAVAAAARATANANLMSDPALVQQRLRFVVVVQDPFAQAPSAFSPVGPGVTAPLRAKAAATNLSFSRSDFGQTPKAAAPETALASPVEDLRHLRFHGCSGTGNALVDVLPGLRQMAMCVLPAADETTDRGPDASPRPPESPEAAVVQTPREIAEEAAVDITRGLLARIPALRDGAGPLADIIVKTHSAAVAALDGTGAVGRDTGRAVGATGEEAAVLSDLASRVASFAFPLKPSASAAQVGRGTPGPTPTDVPLPAALAQKTTTVEGTNVRPLEPLDAIPQGELIGDSDSEAGTPKARAASTATARPAVVPSPAVAAKLAALERLLPGILPSGMRTGPERVQSATSARSAGGASVLSAGSHPSIAGNDGRASYADRRCQPPPPAGTDIVTFIATVLQILRYRTPNIRRVLHEQSAVRQMAQRFDIEEEELLEKRESLYAASQRLAAEILPQERRAGELAARITDQRSAVKTLESTAVTATARSETQLVRIEEEIETISLHLTDAREQLRAVDSKLVASVRTMTPTDKIKTLFEATVLLLGETKEKLSAVFVRTTPTYWMIAQRAMEVPDAFLSQLINCEPNIAVVGGGPQPDIGKPRSIMKGGPPSPTHRRDQRASPLSGSLLKEDMKEKEPPKEVTIERLEELAASISGTNFGQVSPFVLAVSELVAALVRLVRLHKQAAAVNAEIRARREETFLAVDGLEDRRDAMTALRKQLGDARQKLARRRAEATRNATAIATTERKIISVRKAKQHFDEFQLMVEPEMRRARSLDDGALTAEAIVTALRLVVTPHAAPELRDRGMAAALRVLQMHEMSVPRAITHGTPAVLQDSPFPWLPVHRAQGQFLSGHTELMLEFVGRRMACSAVGFCTAHDATATAIAERIAAVASMELTARAAVKVAVKAAKRTARRKSKAAVDAQARSPNRGMSPNTSFQLDSPNRTPRTSPIRGPPPAIAPPHHSDVESSSTDSDEDEVTKAATTLAAVQSLSGVPKKPGGVAVSRLQETEAPPQTVRDHMANFVRQPTLRAPVVGPMRPSTHHDDVTAARKAVESGQVLILDLRAQGFLPAPCAPADLHSAVPSADVSEATTGAELVMAAAATGDDAPLFSQYHRTVSAATGPQSTPASTHGAAPTLAGCVSAALPSEWRALCAIPRRLRELPRDAGAEDDDDAGSGHFAQDYRAFGQSMVESDAGEIALAASIASQSTPGTSMAGEPRRMKRTASAVSFTAEGSTAQRPAPVYDGALEAKRRRKRRQPRSPLAVTVSFFGEPLTAAAGFQLVLLLPEANAAVTAPSAAPVAPALLSKVPALAPPSADTAPSAPQPSLMVKHPSSNTAGAAMVGHDDVVALDCDDAGPGDAEAIFQLLRQGTKPDDAIREATKALLEAERRFRCAREQAGRLILLPSLVDDLELIDGFDYAVEAAQAALSVGRDAAATLNALARGERETHAAAVSVVSDSAMAIRALNRAAPDMCSACIPALLALLERARHTRTLAAGPRRLGVLLGKQLATVIVPGWPAPLRPLCTAVLASSLASACAAAEPAVSPTQQAPISLGSHDNDAPDIPSYAARPLAAALRDVVQVLSREDTRFMMAPLSTSDSATTAVAPDSDDILLMRLMTVAAVLARHVQGPDSVSADAPTVLSPTSSAAPRAMGRAPSNASHSSQGGPRVTADALWAFDVNNVRSFAKRPKDSAANASSASLDCRERSPPQPSGMTRTYHRSPADVLLSPETPLERLLSAFAFAPNPTDILAAAAVVASDLSKGLLVPQEMVASEATPGEDAPFDPDGLEPPGSADSRRSTPRASATASAQSSRPTSKQQQRDREGTLRAQGSAAAATAAADAVLSGGLVPPAVDTSLGSPAAGTSPARSAVAALRKASNRPEAVPFDSALLRPESLTPQPPERQQAGAPRPGRRRSSVSVTAPGDVREDRGHQPKPPSGGSTGRPTQHTFGAAPTPIPLASMSEEEQLRLHATTRAAELDAPLHAARAVIAFATKHRFPIVATAATAPAAVRAIRELGAAADPPRRVEVLDAVLPPSRAAQGAHWVVLPSRGRTARDAADVARVIAQHRATDARQLLWVAVGAPWSPCTDKSFAAAKALELAPRPSAPAGAAATVSRRSVISSLLRVACGLPQGVSQGFVAPAASSASIPVGELHLGTLLRGEDVGTGTSAFDSVRNFGLALDLTSYEPRADMARHATVGVVRPLVPSAVGPVGGLLQGVWALHCALAHRHRLGHPTAVVDSLRVDDDALALATRLLLRMAAPVSGFGEDGAVAIVDPMAVARQVAFCLYSQASSSPSDIAGIKSLVGHYLADATSRQGEHFSLGGLWPPTDAPLRGDRAVAAIAPDSASLAELAICGVDTATTRRVLAFGALRAVFPIVALGSPFSPLALQHRHAAAHHYVHTAQLVASAQSHPGQDPLSPAALSPPASSAPPSLPANLAMPLPAMGASASVVAPSAGHGPHLGLGAKTSAHVLLSVSLNSVFAECYAAAVRDLMRDVPRARRLIQAYAADGPAAVSPAAVAPGVLTMDPRTTPGVLRDSALVLQAVLRLHFGSVDTVEALADVVADAATSAAMADTAKQLNEPVDTKATLPPRAAPPQPGPAAEIPSGTAGVPSQRTSLDEAGGSKGTDGGALIDLASAYAQHTQSMDVPEVPGPIAVPATPTSSDGDTAGLLQLSPQDKADSGDDDDDAPPFVPSRKKKATAEPGLRSLELFTAMHLPTLSPAKSPKAKGGPKPRPVQLMWWLPPHIRSFLHIAAMTPAAASETLSVQQTHYAQQLQQFGTFVSPAPSTGATPSADWTPAALAHSPCVPAAYRATPSTGLGAAPIAGHRSSLTPSTMSPAHTPTLPPAPAVAPAVPLGQIHHPRRFIAHWFAAAVANARRAFAEEHSAVSPHKIDASAAFHNPGVESAAASVEAPPTFRLGLVALPSAACADPATDLLLLGLRLAPATTAYAPLFGATDSAAALRPAGSSTSTAPQPAVYPTTVAFALRLVRCEAGAVADTESSGDVSSWVHTMGPQRQGLSDLESDRPRCRVVLAAPPPSVSALSDTSAAAPPSSRQQQLVASVVSAAAGTAAPVVSPGLKAASMSSSAPVGFTAFYSNPPSRHASMVGMPPAFARQSSGSFSLARGPTADLVGITKDPPADDGSSAPDRAQLPTTGTATAPPAGPCGPELTAILSSLPLLAAPPLAPSPGATLSPRVPGAVRPSLLSPVHRRPSQSPIDAGVSATAFAVSLTGVAPPTFASGGGVSASLLPSADPSPQRRGSRVFEASRRRVSSARTGADDVATLAVTAGMELVFAVPDELPFRSSW